MFASLVYCSFMLWFMMFNLDTIDAFPFGRIFYAGFALLGLVTIAAASARSNDGLT